VNACPGALLIHPLREQMVATGAMRTDFSRDGCATAKTAWGRGGQASKGAKSSGCCARAKLRIFVTFDAERWDVIDAPGGVEKYVANFSTNSGGGGGGKGNGKSGGGKGNSKLPQLATRDIAGYITRGGIVLSNAGGYLHTDGEIECLVAWV
jgi:hypothetical protein